MAYITNHNLKRIIEQGNFEFLNLTGEVYKTPISFLSKAEKKQLLTIKELLENPEKYLKGNLKPIKVRDTGKYIHPEKQPAYHLNEDCIRLTADFIEFEIPEEIKKGGYNKIEEFRDWFADNLHLLQFDKAKEFVRNLEIKYGIKRKPEEVFYYNSGKYDFKKTVTILIENKIDELLNKIELYFRESVKNQKILNSLSKASGLVFVKGKTIDNQTEYPDNEVIGILKEFHKKFKIPFREMVINWYKSKANTKFDEKALKALGFRLCVACSQPSGNTIIDVMKKMGFTNSDEEFARILNNKNRAAEKDEEKKKRNQKNDELTKEEIRKKNRAIMDKLLAAAKAVS